MEVSGPSGTVGYSAAPTAVSLRPPSRSSHSSARGGGGKSKGRGKSKDRSKRVGAVAGGDFSGF